MSGSSRYDKEHLVTEIPVRNSPSERGRAVRHVASMARDAKDAAELLAMLGLDATEGAQERAA